MEVDQLSKQGLTMELGYYSFVTVANGATEEINGPIQNFLKSYRINVSVLRVFDFYCILCDA